jgi:hypothetical protein
MAASRRAQFFEGKMVFDAADFDEYEQVVFLVIPPAGSGRSSPCTIQHWAPRSGAAASFPTWTTRRRFVMCCVCHGE